MIMINILIAHWKFTDHAGRINYYGEPVGVLYNLIEYLKVTCRMPIAAYQMPSVSLPNTHS